MAHPKPKWHAEKGKRHIYVPFDDCSDGDFDYCSLCDNGRTARLRSEIHDDKKLPRCKDCLRLARQIGKMAEGEGLMRGRIWSILKAAPGRA